MARLLHHPKNHQKSPTAKPGVKLAKITTAEIDVASVTSIKQAAEKLAQDKTKIDFLLLNAGFTDSPPFDATANTKFGMNSGSGAMVFAGNYGLCGTSYRRKKW